MLDDDLKGAYRIPPNSAEVEQSILAALLYHPACMVEAVGKIKPEDFYRQCHQLIFNSLLEMFEKGEAIDVLTVSEWLNDSEALEAAGGRGYISDLAMSCANWNNVGWYITRLKELSTSRQVILAGYEIVSYDGENPLEHGQQLLQNIAVGQYHNKEFSMSELQAIALDNLENAQNGLVSGQPMGFCKLDRLMGGLKPSDLIILAARPSMGKTALAVNIASNVAIRNQSRVLVFSLEMSDVSLVERILVSEAESNLLHKIKAVQLPQHYRIMDTPGIGLTEIRARIMREQTAHGPIGLVVIDYLQLMAGQGENQNIRVANISRGLKNLAREFKIPVLCLSQLSRSVEQRADKRPMLSDLRDSGAIEQDADIVMFIYRDEYYNKDTNKPGIAEIIIAKHRNGPVGTVELNFWPSVTRFFNTGGGNA